MGQASAKAQGLKTAITSGMHSSIYSLVCKCLTNIINFCVDIFRQQDAVRREPDSVHPCRQVRQQWQGLRGWPAEGWEEEVVPAG